VKLSHDEYQSLEQAKALIMFCGINSFDKEAQKIVKDNGALGSYVQLGTHLIIKHLKLHHPEEAKKCLG